jgi:hypothetical protein
VPVWTRDSGRESNFTPSTAAVIQGAPPHSSPRARTTSFSEGPLVVTGSAAVPLRWSLSAKPPDAAPSATTRPRTSKSTDAASASTLVAPAADDDPRERKAQVSARHALRSQPVRACRSKGDMLSLKGRRRDAHAPVRRHHRGISISGPAPTPSAAEST